MPLYEYICQNCRQIFDSLRPMQDADKSIECTYCHSDQTTRMISLFNAQTGGRSNGNNSAAGCSGCSASSCAGCRR